MDESRRQQERSAHAGDALATLRAIAADIRLGELPVGTIVELDHARYPKRGWRPLDNTGVLDAPGYLSGRWLIQAEGNGWFELRRVGRNDAPLSTSRPYNVIGVTEEELRTMLVTARAPVGTAPPKDAPADTAPIVRQESPIGECDRLGRLVRETDRYYVYEFRGREVEHFKISKEKAHLEPCTYCGS